MRNFILQLILALTLTTVFTACGGGNNSETDGTTDGEMAGQPAPEEVKPPVAIEADWAAAEKNEIEDGALVYIDAYAGPLPMTIYTSGNKLRLNFFQRRNQDEGYHLYAEIPTGTSPNRVKTLPEQYQQSDLVITADDGTKIGVGDHVRLEGTYSPSSGEDYDYLDVQKIVKVDAAFDEAVFESARELTDELLQDSTFRSGYVYLEGKLELSMFMSTFGDDSYSVTIKQKNNDYVKSVSIRMGEETSTMQALPNNFTDKDFIIRDYKGETHKGKSNFKFYGTYKKLKNYGSKEKDEAYGVFHVEEIVKP